jgi:hypothetical protein
MASPPNAMTVTDPGHPLNGRPGGYCQGPIPLGTTGHRFMAQQILIWPGNLQRKMVGEPNTPYHVGPHHPCLKGRNNQPKMN